MFVEIILSLKNCRQLTRHGLCLRNEITVDVVKNLTENLIFDLKCSSLSVLDLCFVTLSLWRVVTKKKKQNYIFQATRLVTIFTLSVCLDT